MSRLATVRDDYVEAVRGLMPLFGSRELDVRWTADSALEGWTVQVLAGHLARVVTVPRYVLDTPPPEGPPSDQEGLTLGRVARSEERDRTARDNALEYTGDTPVALRARFERDLDALTELVRKQPPDRLVLTKGTRVVELDRYLIGRALELLVHADDLAVSLGLPTPEAPKELMASVLDLLFSTAAARHGELRVLRAMTRRERDVIDALRIL